MKTHCKQGYLLFVLAGASTLASAQAGVSIGVSQPGVYGRIDIGNFPRPPEVILPQPVVIVPQPYAAQRQPIYLYVPPGHQQNWSRYCNRYGACQQPVYFVKEQWVRDRYEHEHPGWDRGLGHDRDRHEGHKDKKRDSDHGRQGGDRDRGDGDRSDDKHGR